ncbi:MAG: cycY [Verrucomicrobia bacterium]|nr:cycY [Verrucomicrobiota bacterium]
MKRIAILTALLTCLTLSTSAAKIGDKAAPLVIQDWVKGSAVNVLDGKNVYVVEFWATWCGPCKTSIPHLTDLQKKFKGKNVVFIGISDEEKSDVAPFVKEMGPKMDYVVATDKDRKTTEAYMKAYDQKGIPAAFIVGKDGKVLWVGHPMAELEETLTEVVAGKFDLAAAIKRDEGRVLVGEFQQLTAQGDPKAKEVGAKLLTVFADDHKALTAFAFEAVADPKITNRNFAFAESALDAAEKAPGSELHLIKAVRAVVRFESGKTEEGLKLIDEAIEATEHAADKAQYNSFKRVMKARVEEVQKKQP